MGEARDRMFHIGKVCSQWAGLEFIIAHLIWEMLKLDRPVGRIVTGGLDMLPRLRMAINLARELRLSRPLIAALECTRKTVQDDLIAKRNLVVHGFAWDFDETPTVYLEQHRTGDRKPIRMDLAEIEALAMDINAATRKLAVAAHETGFMPLEPDVIAEIAETSTERTASETPPDSGSHSHNA